MTEQTPGEDAGEQAVADVVVGKSVAHTRQSVWKFLMTDAGAEALLGRGGRLGSKGHPWRAEDGTCGVTRSFHPLEQIRFTWHRSEDAGSTMVDLHLTEDGPGTRIDIVHGHLPSHADRDFLSAHWNDALERIDTSAE